MNKKESILNLKEAAEQVLRDDGKYSRFDVYTPYYEKSLLADTDAIAHDGDEVHIHGGIDRMTGLISMVEDANESGHNLPLILMRDENNKLLPLHTHAQIRPLLHQVRQRKNRVESAHNKVMEKYQAIASVRDDETQDFSARLAKGNEALEFVRNYRTHLHAEIAKYDPDALPDDLETLKAVYSERLEAEARRRVNFFQGVLTQQGAILPPGCDEEEGASRKVAALLRVNTIRIYAADDAAEAKAAFDAGVSEIRAVYPINIPAITVNAKPYPSSQDRVALTASALTVFADHPQRGRLTDLNVGFKVFDGALRLRPAFTRYVPQQGETRKGFTIDLTSHPGKTLKVDISARNACGPAESLFSVSVPN